MILSWQDELYLYVDAVIVNGCTRIITLIILITFGFEDHTGIVENQNKVDEDRKVHYIVAPDDSAILGEGCLIDSFGKMER